MCDSSRLFSCNRDGETPKAFSSLFHLMKMKPHSSHYITCLRYQVPSPFPLSPAVLSSSQWQWENFHRWCLTLQLLPMHCSPRFSNVFIVWVPCPLVTLLSSVTHMHTYTYWRVILYGKKALKMQLHIIILHITMVPRGLSWDQDTIVLDSFLAPNSVQFR